MSCDTFMCVCHGRIQNVKYQSIKYPGYCLVGEREKDEEDDDDDDE